MATRGIDDSTFVDLSISAHASTIKTLPARDIQIDSGTNYHLNHEKIDLSQ